MTTTAELACKHYFDAWNALDPVAIVASLVEGGTYLDPYVGTPVAGEALAGYATMLFAAFPDLRFEVVSTTAEHDTVAVQWLMRGTNAGPMLGFPASGSEVALPGVDVIATIGEKVARVEGHFDRQALSEQLGLRVTMEPT